MTGLIKNFVANATSLDSVVMIVMGVLIAGILGFLYGVYKNILFRRAWEEEINSIKIHMEVGGEKAILLLIDIAMLQADKDSALVIGEVKNEFMHNRLKDDFFEKVLDLMEKINDNNHTVILNSDYALLRDSIQECLDIIAEFREPRSFEDLSVLIVSSSDARRNLSNAVKGIGMILYGVKGKPFPETPNEDEG